MSAGASRAAAVTRAPERPDRSPPTITISTLWPSGWCCGATTRLPPTTIVYVTEIARHGSRANGLLRAALGILLVIATGVALLRLVLVYPPLVDLEIPLRAAERWLAGESPYLASAFDQPAGYTLPFLYAPPTLPFFAALSLLPREVAAVPWITACVAGAILATRRLGVPWLAVPFVLAWPPLAEALYGGNVQVFMFAAFVMVFWTRAPGPWRPRELDVATAPDPIRRGTLATFIPAMKVSIPHAWVGLARRRPAAAAWGAAVAIAIVLVTLPLVGISLWGEWIAQLQRALNSAWTNGGYRLFPGLPLAVSGFVWLSAVLACLVVPRGRLGTWVGVLSVLGAASLHTFSLLFVLPALLVVRREVGLVAAVLIAAGTPVGLWGGALVVGLTLALAERRPRLREGDAQALDDVAAA